ncbi:MAG: hypothetical protein C4334_05640 [Pyrinomonas sp.]|uniref:CPBP family intramembrane glutamic endopeptidase n=1 Tax=Pyrinomonas sp. TaxID=2080306 RepID=UPI003333CFB7
MGSEQLAQRDEKIVAFWEIISVVASVLITSWVVVPLSGSNRLGSVVPGLLAVAFMLYSHRLHGETAREIGWRVDNFLPATCLLIGPMVLGALLLLLVGWVARKAGLGEPERVRSAWWILLWGFAWGLLQQYALQGFIHRRLRILLGRGPKAYLSVALIFALLHAPNLGLMAATFLGGLIWASVYDRVPNLLALGLSHSTMSWLLIRTLPDSLIVGLRVGYKYFT